MIYGLLILIGLLNIIDTSTTLYLTVRGAVEANPLMRCLLERGCFVEVKSFSTALTLVFAKIYADRFEMRISNRTKVLGSLTLLIPAVLLGMVVANNIMIIALQYTPFESLICGLFRCNL